MPQASVSLQHLRSPLADPVEQLRILRLDSTPSFEQTVAQQSLLPLRAEAIDLLQANLGKLCNMTCRHCHVDAGPDRREIMSEETIEQCLDVVRRCRIPTLDLTGGAPEMNPGFRHFVKSARQAGTHVIDRCNLTILDAPGYQGLSEFLAEHSVEIVASLPCYLEVNTDRQRGDGAWKQSIIALRQLNRLGYGLPGSDLRLTLVYNPVGPSLPPPQELLEVDYRKVLREQHGIEFTRLFTITNMPISRFLDDLLQSGKYEAYMQKLAAAFNPAAYAGVMCRRLISVSWDGTLHDCDFNQMLALPLHPHAPRHIRDFNPEQLANREIMTGAHCFGCTAASGSGCLGATATRQP